MIYEIGMGSCLYLFGVICMQVSVWLELVLPFVVRRHHYHDFHDGHSKSRSDRKNDTKVVEAQENIRVLLALRRDDIRFTHVSL